MSSNPALSPDEADTVEAVAQFHEAHHDAASRPQQLIDHLTGALGRPMALLILLAILVGWLGVGAWRGGAALASAATWLEVAASVSALLVAMIILTLHPRI